MGMDAYEKLADEVVGLMDAKGPYAAIEMLEQARKDGSMDAVAILGELYLEGIGVIADTEMGLDLLDEAAKAGNAHADETLGKMYLNGNFGVEQDEERGHAFIERAAEAGLPTSIGLCAADYFWGVGVPIDQAKGVEWATRGAKMGNCTSNHICAIAYQAGEGAPLNLALAIQHYREVLREWSDNGDAMCEMAVCLADPFDEYGIFPAPTDLSEAFALLSKGVELGSVRAHYVLGACYANGKGVQQDYDLAHHYVELAAQNGDPDAQDALGRFRRTMRGQWTL